MPTIQERRRDELSLKLTRALEARDDLLRRLVRMEVYVTKLRRGLKRYEKIAPAKPSPSHHIAETGVMMGPTDASSRPIEQDPFPHLTRAGLEPLDMHDDRDDIPAYLRRAPASKKDDEARAEILAEQEARKTAKARGRIAKLKAAQSGDTKRMPLTGKAALDAIRNG